MSAQKTPRRGVVSAIAGLVGFSALSGLLVTVMIAPAVAVTGITASSTIGIFDSLPEYLEIGAQRERNEIFSNDATGNQLIATIFSQNRETIDYDQISPFVLNAAIDGEDRRFYDHGGVDVASVVRAAVGQATGTSQSGASTLTMQLVKNIFVQDALDKPTEEERKAAYADATATSFDRKLKEMKYAIGIEKKYTKKEVLTAYLNIAFFGANTYGIQAAAQRYYSVNASDLTLPQAASLIAIVQYPGIRSLDNPEHYQSNQERRDVILYAMYDVGSITEQEYRDAIAVPVDDTTLAPSPASTGCIAAAQPYAKWFCDYVVKSVKDFAFLGADKAERERNWELGGYKLYTTLDLDAQRTALDATYQFAPNSEASFELGSATSMVEPGTGRVLVMVQNKDFDDTLDGGGPTTTAVNFNTGFAYGGSSGFPVGSTYKLFTLVEWLNQGKGVNEQVNGSGRTIKFNTFKDSCPDGTQGTGEFTFKNDSTSSGGSMTVRRGTVYSINGAFFSMAQQLDMCNIHKVAAEMGVKRADDKPLAHNVSAIIGAGNELTPLSMATAYATVAAQGLSCAPIVVDRATGPKGEDLGGQARDCKQVISPDVANTAVDVLKGVMNFSFAKIGDGVPVFGKTGTTNEALQTWVVASSSKATSATWVGNIKGNKNIQTTSYGGSRGDYLRTNIMKATLGGYNARFGGDDWPGPAPSLLNGVAAPTVPDVRGQSPEAARALLEGLGFGFADGGQTDSELEAGRVTNTEPGAGSSAAKGTTVTIFTSKGNKVAFPDVVGNGTQFSFNQAKSALASAGWGNVTEACAVIAPTGNPTQGPGLPGGGNNNNNDPRIDRVQSSSPAPGAFSIPGEPVTLTVGKANC